MSAPESPAERVERYGELQPLYDAFTHRLMHLLERLVEDEGIEAWHVYSWARDTSFFENALNRSRRAGRPEVGAVDGIADVAGVAFVTYARGEAETIAAIVERELEVDYEHSSPPAVVREHNERNRAADPPVVGYEHITYVVHLDETRRSLSEWAPYADLRVEVHVPTISQYAWWCMANGHLPFAWDSSYPPATREAFARAAALLGEVDEALASEEAARERIEARYEDAVTRGELEIPLDARALAVYLRLSEPLAELAAVAEAQGMIADEQPDLAPSNTTLEQEQLWLLGRYDIGTLETLDAFLRRAAPRAPAILGDIARISSEGGFVPYATKESIITMLVLVLNRAGPEEIELVEYRDELTHALNTVIGNPVPGT